MNQSNNRAILILLITFSMVVSLKPAKAQEAMSPQVSPEENKIEYKSEGLRDPFQDEKREIIEEPVQVETKPLPSLQIEGVVWGGSLPQAIINNRVMRVGDTVEGARITDINQSGVTVFFENRQYNLTTSSPISSQGAKNNP